jgi:hypothetical protein
LILIGDYKLAPILSLKY